MKAIKELPEAADSLGDQASTAADHLLRSTRQAAGDALDGAAETLQAAGDATRPALVRAAGRADALVQRGLGAMRQGSRQLRHTAQRTSVGAASYIRHEPLKAVLIAAASGAALMAVINLLRHSPAAPAPEKQR